MRWYWIDRFIEFESGQYAKAIKAVTLAEDHLHDHFPNYPVMPKSLIIEGMAQTGGLLLCEQSQFTAKVVLAKISKVKFHSEAVPGDILTYTATIDDVNKTGAKVTTTSYKGSQLHAEMEVLFAYLKEEHDQSLFNPGDYVRMFRLLRVYDVGHAADGTPLQVIPVESCKTVSE